MLMWNQFFFLDCSCFIYVVWNGLPRCQGKVSWIGCWQLSASSSTYDFPRSLRWTGAMLISCFFVLRCYVKFHRRNHWAISYAEGFLDGTGRLSTITTEAFLTCASSSKHVFRVCPALVGTLALRQNSPHGVRMQQLEESRHRNRDLYPLVM